jgi:hypothetical protein
LLDDVSVVESLVLLFDALPNNESAFIPSNRGPSTGTEEKPSVEVGWTAPTASGMIAASADE